MACIRLYPAAIVVDGGLWIEWTDNLIQRFNLATGKKTGEVDNSLLVGDVYGSIWVQNGAGLTAVSPSGQLPPGAGTPYGGPEYQAACGALWLLGQDGAGSGTLSIVDSAGRATPLAGSVSRGASVLDIGSSCWIEQADGRGGTSLTRISHTCVGNAVLDVTSGAYPFALGETYWVTVDGDVSLVPFDPVTLEGYGRGWLSPSGSPWGTVVEASGQVWADDGGKFERLDIPVSPIPGQATWPPVVCAAPSPNPTPTATATPSPTPTATATPSSTPTATPSPTPTATPTPTSTPTPTATGTPSPTSTPT
jgi:hypothetical protein